MLLGWRIDSAKEQVPSHSIIFFGNNENYCPQDAEDLVVLQAKELRIEAVSVQLAKIKANKRLTVGEAKSVRGRVLHLASTSAGRVGKGILYHVGLRADEKSNLWSEGLAFNIEFLE